MRSSHNFGIFLLAFSLCAAASCVVAAPAPVSSLILSGGGAAEIERLERQLEVRNKVQIDMQNQLVSLLQEVDELRGKLEKSNYELRLMNERQRDLYKQVEALKQNKPAPKQSNTSTSKNSKAVIYSNNPSENTQYNLAVDQILKEKDYAGAMKSFESFIAKYPNSVYASNVYYWLGQLNLTKGELDIAKKHFTQVVRYKDSNKKAEALLKLGTIANRQKDTTTAKKFYRQIVTEFPDTASAKEAQGLLKQ